MTTIDISALAAKAVWTRFMAAADTDKDGDLSGDELEALIPKDKVEKIVTRNDANGDGRLSADELPRGAFNSRLVAVLLDAQAYRDASPEARAADDANAVASLFESADVDGDGVLSKDELDAENAINMAMFLDTGDVPDAVFMVRGGADGNMMKPEDFVVGRAAKLETVSASELPDGWQDGFRQVREAAEAANPRLKDMNLPDGRAEMKDRIAATPMSAAFMTRLLMMMSENGGSGTTA